MYFLQNGEPECIELDRGDMDLFYCGPTSAEYPKFVQFSANTTSPMVAVSDDGEVWIVHDSDCMTKIPELSNIRAVHVNYLGHQDDFRILSLISKNGKLVTVKCTKDFRIIWTITHQYPEQVTQTTHKYAICSEGNLYAFDKSTLGYNEVKMDAKVVTINDYMVGTAMLLDNRTIVCKNGIAFDLEPVLCLYNMTILTESGIIFELSENNVAMQIPNPEEVSQLHVDKELLTCVILCKNGNLVLYKRNSRVEDWILIMIAPDVDCLSGARVM